MHAVGSLGRLHRRSPVAQSARRYWPATNFSIALTDRRRMAEPPTATSAPGHFSVGSRQWRDLTLAANDSCWQGRPFVDAIEFVRTGRSIRDQWLDLSVGRADVVEVPPEDVAPGAATAARPLRSRRRSSCWRSGLPTPARWRIQHLRAAIASAVDRSALFNVIFQKQGEITASLLPQAAHRLLISLSRRPRPEQGARAARRADASTLTLGSGGRRRDATGGATHRAQSA